MGFASSHGWQASQEDVGSFSVGEGSVSGLVERGPWSAV